MSGRTAESRAGTAPCAKPNQSDHEIHIERKGRINVWYPVNSKDPAPAPPPLRVSRTVFVTKPSSVNLSGIGYFGP